MKDRDLGTLFEHVATSEDVLLAASPPSEAARRQLAEYVAQRSPRRPRLLESRRSRWTLLSLAAALACGVFATRSLWSDSSLTFSVGTSAASGALGTWQSAPEDGRLPLRFSDGTRVELEPKARARVVAIGPYGAEIVLESGAAHLDVVPVRKHAPGGSPWRVSTGPFSVEVKGTRFDVAWDPGADEFSLDLFEGSVVVKGCGPEAGHVISAGQGVRASCGRAAWAIVPLGQAASSAAPATQAAPTEVPATQDALAAPGSSGRAAPSRATSGNRRAGSWQALARAGRYQRAYAQLTSSDFEAEYASASAQELLLLGDVARLSGDTERARRSYAALRRRFPGDEAASQAAFALGRASLDQDPRAAAQWFDVYLEERPHGPLAQAALDRLLELAVADGDAGRLAEVARTYLDRYPSGSHASLARRILQSAAPTP